MIEDQKMEKSKEIVRYILHEMVEKSTYQYDETEMEAYAQSMAVQYAKEQEEAGEAVDLKDMKAGAVSNMKQYWMAEAFCKAKEIPVDLSAIEEDTDKMIEMMELMGEEVPDRAEMKEMAVQDAYFGGMMTYMDKMIKEKTGGSYGNC